MSTNNATALQTVNLPVALAASQNINVTGGGSLTVNSIISGSGYGLAKTGGGALTLTGEAAGADTYTGATAVNGGTLLLDFTQGGSTPRSANIIAAASPLSLGGGVLSLKSASSSTSQTFADTAVAGGDPW